MAAADAARTGRHHLGARPFAGFVSKVQMDVGEIATMMPPSVLLRLVDLSSVDVRVKVHERELARVAIGDAVRGQVPEQQPDRAWARSPSSAPRSTRAPATPRWSRASPMPTVLLRAGMFAEIEHQAQGQPSRA